MSDPSAYQGLLLADGAADRPLVSVAIVSFNHRDFIGPAIDSVLAQDYPNVEIVISDDASTDGTAQVIADYARRFPDRIRATLHERNEGITRNSNTALAMARGKYVAFLGSDDLMLPGKLTAQVDLMEADQACALCYHDLDVFQSETDETLWLFSQRNRPHEGKAKDLMQYGCFNGACSTMVRADAMPEHGFDFRIPRCSDWLFWMNTAERGTIRYIDKVLGRYRRHASNVTGDEDIQDLMVQDLLTVVVLEVIQRPAIAPEAAWRFGLILLAYGRRRAGLDRLLLLALGTVVAGGRVPLAITRWVARPFYRSRR